MVSERVEPERFVFVDGMGANTSLSVLEPWSRRGERAYCSVPRPWKEEHNATGQHEHRGHETFSGSAGNYHRHRLRDLRREDDRTEPAARTTCNGGHPLLRSQGSARLAAHRRAGLRAGVLPPYSPDLSPIEEAFSKIKGILARRRPGAGKLWWKQWAGRSTRSRLGMRKAFSSTADTGYWFNHRESRCREMHATVAGPAAPGKRYSTGRQAWPSGASHLSYEHVLCAGVSPGS
jgi:hypothetical protein